MIDKIKDWFKVYSRQSESQTERDGFLSYAGEFHAITIGIAIGAYAAISKDPLLVKAMFGLALGLGAMSGSQRRLRKALRKTGAPEKLESAIGEVRREPWYSAGGTILSFIVTATIMYGPEYIQQVVGSIV